MSVWWPGGEERRICTRACMRCLEFSSRDLHSTLPLVTGLTTALVQMARARTRDGSPRPAGGRVVCIQNSIVNRLLRTTPHVNSLEVSSLAGRFQSRVLCIRDLPGSAPKSTVCQGERQTGLGGTGSRNAHGCHRLAGLSHEELGLVTSYGMSQAQTQGGHGASSKAASLGQAQSLGRDQAVRPHRSTLQAGGR